MKTVTVDLGARSYPIHIGEGILRRAKNLLPFDIEKRRVFILFDQNAERHARTLAAGFDNPVLHGVKGGEGAKSYQGLQEVLSWLLENRVDRKSVLFTVGGGVIGDLGGFAASIVLRGIDFVQVPTTLLSQVDSSVGGKTGINAAQGKNLIGSFYQPVCVLCDLETLKTLPEREVKAGYAEIVKYGLLGNAQFYEWLEENGKAVLALEPVALSHAIETSCRMKAEIVGTDEREREGGRRALLNLGHTFAHALEAAAGFDGRLLHGEAVSIGMALAFRLSAKMGLCPPADAARVEAHLKGLHMPTEISSIRPCLKQSAEEIVALMHHDKKASGGKIGFILTRGIGKAFQTAEVEMEAVREIVS
jgi:3-dehydroquinate synthase